MSDDRLLSEFAASRSEGAFEALVRQHVNLVFATALRHVDDRSLAEDITQDVFVVLARKAGTLQGHATVAGWLHRTTLLECRQVVRGELRRQRREQIAAVLGTTAPEADSGWTALLPILDEALLQLGEKERLAVILRFLEERPLGDVAQALRTSPNAAGKQVAKALDRLGQVFRKFGFAVPSGAGAVLLAGAAAQAAPAGIEFAITKAAAAAMGTGAATAGATASGTHLFQLMAQIKASTIAVFLVSAALPITVQVATHARTRHSLALPPTGAQTAVLSDARDTGSRAQGAGGPIAAGPGQRHLVDGLDLDLLARQLARLPDPANPPEFEIQLRRLMFTLNLRQVQAVAGLFNGLQNQETLFGVAGALASRWAELEPREAVLAAPKLSPTLGDSSQIEALKTWATADPAAALQWMAGTENLSSPLQQSIQYACVFRQLVRKNPRAALERALQIENRDHQRDALATALPALTSWAQTSPEEALGWAEARQEWQRDQWAAAVLDGIKEVDPRRAVEISLKAQNPRVRADGILSAMLKWCQTDPEAAAQAFLSLPEQDRDSHTLEQLILRWSANDRVAAEKWVAGLPDSPMKNVAARTLNESKRARGQE
jgi:RNA polymerase sigma factor (sigma-70 family)